jgi:hypothetical protein
MRSNAGMANGQGGVDLPFAQDFAPHLSFWPGLAWLDLTWPQKRSGIWERRKIPSRNSNHDSTVVEPGTPFGGADSRWQNSCLVGSFGAVFTKACRRSLSPYCPAHSHPLSSRTIFRSYYPHLRLVLSTCLFATGISSIYVIPHRESMIIGTVYVWNRAVTDEYVYKLRQTVHCVFCW